MEPAGESADGGDPSPNPASVWSAAVTGEPGAATPRRYRAPSLWQCLLASVGCVLLVAPLRLAFMWEGLGAADPANPAPVESQRSQAIASREAEFQTRYGMWRCAAWGAAFGAAVGLFFGAALLYDALRGAALGLSLGFFVGLGLAVVPYDFPTYATMLLSLPVALIVGRVYWSKFGEEDRRPSSAPVGPARAPGE